MTRTKEGEVKPLTAERIKSAAWVLMAQHGTSGLSLRRIARQLGVTAPAIYNYFSRLEDLITALIVDAFTALAETMEAAEANVPPDLPYDTVITLCLTYRKWAMDHPIAFQLIYGNPIPGYSAPPEITIPLARRPFLGMFRCFIGAYNAGEMTIPPERLALPTNTVDGIRGWKRMSGIEMPDSLVALLMSGWARIHGMIMLELFGHIQPLVGEGSDFFRYEIDAFCHHMGMVKRNLSNEGKQDV